MFLLSARQKVNIPSLFLWFLWFAGGFLHIYEWHRRLFPRGE